MIILLFFGAWIALLIVLKLCFGSSKVGWLSGRRQPLPKKPTDQPGLVLENPDSGGNKLEEKAHLTASLPPQDVAMELNKMQQQQQQNPQDDSEPVAQNDYYQPPNDCEHDDAAVAAAATADTITDPRTSIALTSPQTIEEWNKMYHQKIKQQRWLKATVIVACLIVVSMAIIMATKGLQSLRGSFNYSRKSMTFAQETIYAASRTVGGLALFLRSFQADMQLLLNGTNAICPNIRPFLCENLSNADTCNTTGVFGGTEAGQELGEIFQQLVQVFYRDWKIATQLQELEQELVDLSAAAAYAEGQISAFGWVFYVAVVFDVMVGLLAVAMIVFLLLPSMRARWCLQCMHHRCLFPIFIVLVLLSFIFAIAFLIASLVSSDAYVQFG
jgi:hypothetical protein